MDQRIEFALKSLTTTNFQALCREYSISRKTGYKWKERFLEHGLAGAQEQSRRPLSNARELSESVVCELIRFKQRHPTWGPEKIHCLYERAHSEQAKESLPSLSSVKRVLDRAGLVEKRKVRRAAQGGRIHSGREAEKPNDVWTIDFKGWWRDPKGEKCEPLTVRDEFTRYVLALQRTANGRTETVRSSFEALFERHGLPGAIRSDNGPPFASITGVLGLSRLSAWWVALGIDLERSRPGCPQDNGAHERMHLDIENELAGMKSDQASFDVWRRIFNEERPHKALGNRFPSELYQNSPRAYAGAPADLEYEGMETRRIPASGILTWHNRHVFVSQAIAGWSVGIKPARERLEIYFANLCLGHLEPATASFIRADVGPNETGGTVTPTVTQT